MGLNITFSFFENLLVKRKEKVFLSLDIGSINLKIVLLRYLENKLELVDFIIKDISIQESKKKDDVIIDTVQKFIERNNIKPKGAYLSFSHPSLYFKHLTLPFIPYSELKEAIPWQVKDILPYDVNEASFDWDILEEKVTEDGTKNIDIMLVACKRDAILEKIDLFKRMNLTLFGISVGPFGILDFISALSEGISKEAIASLDIQYDTSSLCIYKNDKLVFARILPYGSNQITLSLTEELVSEKGKLALSYKEAEKIKTEYGIPKDGDIILKGKVTPGHIKSMLRPILERLINDIRDSFDYYAIEYKQKPPQKLYLTGGGSKLKNLISFLKSELNINIDYFGLPADLDYSLIDKTEFQKNISSIAIATGTAIGACKRINLLPEEFRIKKIEFVEKIILRMLSFIILTTLLFSFLETNLRIKDYRKRLKIASIHLQAAGDIKQIQQEVLKYEAIIGKITRNYIPADWILKEISNIIPKGIVLDKLTLNNKTGVLDMEGKVVGAGLGEENIVSEFMSVLNNSIFFSQANLVSFRKGLGKVQHSSFEISCELTKRQ